MEAKLATSWPSKLLGLIVLGTILSIPITVYGQSQVVELVLEQNPPEGGIVNPGSGVHRFAPESEITVTAVPHPGYRFAYWLGDVSDPSASTTQIQLGDSKAVVAVFERVLPDAVGEEEPDRERRGSGGGGGTSGLMPTATNFFTTSWSIGGGGYHAPAAVSGPILIQTPEPATLLLFGLGGTFLIRHPLGRRTRRKRD